VCDFSTVFAVVHKKGVKLGNIVNKELIESVRQ
jgi:hypothetical protein